MQKLYCYVDESGQDTVAKQYANPVFIVAIYIDGINEKKQAEYANELRKIGIRVRRVHRARDESSVLIRLADALAGLAREAVEGKEDAMVLLRRAIQLGVIAEV